MSASRLMLVALVCVPMTACLAKSKAPASAPAPAYQDGDDPLTQLDRLEQQMSALGIERAPSGAGEGAGADKDAGLALEDEADAVAVEERPAAEPEASAPPPADHQPERQARTNRCQSICDLSEAICELEVRICSMSEDHGGDVTYANACHRAADDCELSSDACDHCEP